MAGNSAAGPQADGNIYRASDEAFQLDNLQRVCQETLRVRLLSSPQARQAPQSRRADHAVDVGEPDHDKIAAPATRKAMPSAIRLSKFSWNTKPCEQGRRDPLQRKKQRRGSGVGR